MGVEPDSQTVDSLLKAGCGSHDLAQEVTERMWWGLLAHRHLDATMPPLSKAAIDPELNLETLDLARMVDEVPCDDGDAIELKGFGELASWDSDGRRLSQKLAWVVKAGVPGCGVLVRRATRATLTTQMRTQKCAVDDILELVETL